MSMFSEMDNDDYEKMELRAEDAFNRRLQAQARRHWHPADPDYPYQDEDESEGGVPDGIDAADRLLTVYYSINGAPFTPSSGEVVVGVPATKEDFLLYRFGRNANGVAAVSPDGEHEIGSSSHDDILRNITRIDEDKEQLDDFYWANVPEAPVADHPNLTLSQEQTRIYINDRQLGSIIKPRSISIAILYADEGGAGGDLRLRFDLGNEGILTSAYFDGRLIGSEFTSATSLMESADTDKIETMVTQGGASNDGRIEPLTMNA